MGEEEEAATLAAVKAYVEAKDFVSAEAYALVAKAAGATADGKAKAAFVRVLARPSGAVTRAQLRKVLYDLAGVSAAARAGGAGEGAVAAAAARDARAAARAVARDDDGEEDETIGDEVVHNPKTHHSGTDADEDSAGAAATAARARLTPGAGGKGGARAAGIDDTEGGATAVVHKHKKTHDDEGAKWKKSPEEQRVLAASLKGMATDMTSIINGVEVLANQRESLDYLCQNQYAVTELSKEGEGYTVLKRHIEYSGELASCVVPHNYRELEQYVFFFRRVANELGEGKGFTKPKGEKGRSAYEWVRAMKAYDVSLEGRTAKMEAKDTAVEYLNANFPWCISLTECDLSYDDMMARLLASSARRSIVLTLSQKARRGGAEVGLLSGDGDDGGAVNYTAGAPRPKGVCYSCGKPGHFKRNCPTPEAAAAAQGGRGNGGNGGNGGNAGGKGGALRGKCFNCNAEGHHARQCPTRGGQGGEAVKLAEDLCAGDVCGVASARVGVQVQAHAPLHVSEGATVNTVPMVVCVDTGANVSVMDVDTAAKCGVTVIEQTGVRARTATNALMPVLGVAEVTVSIGGCTAVCVDVLVVAAGTLSMRFILGAASLLQRRNGGHQGLAIWSTEDGPMVRLGDGAPTRASVSKGDVAVLSVTGVEEEDTVVWTLNASMSEEECIELVEEVRLDDGSAVEMTCFISKALWPDIDAYINNVVAAEADVAAAAKGDKDKGPRPLSFAEVQRLAKLNPLPVLPLDEMDELDTNAIKGAFIPMAMGGGRRVVEPAKHGPPPAGEMRAHELIEFGEAKDEDPEGFKKHMEWLRKVQATYGPHRGALKPGDEGYQHFPPLNRGPVFRIELRKNADLSKVRAPFAPRRSEAAQKAVDELRDYLIAEGCAVPSASRVAMGLSVVPKYDENGKTTGHRVCAAAQHLNKNTVGPIAYPMPDVADKVRRMTRGVFRSKVDFTKCFWQYAVDEESVHLNTINFGPGPGNTLAVTRAMFGHGDLPPFIQMHMEGVFGDAYQVIIDDVGWTSNTPAEVWEGHKRAVRRVVMMGGTLDARKCKVGHKRLMYGGYLTSENMVSVAPDKVNALAGRPRPTDTVEVRAMMATAGYLREHYTNKGGFAVLERTVREAVRKHPGGLADWTAAELAALDEVRFGLSRVAYNLAPFRSELPTDVITDASSTTGVGTVFIVQKEPSGKRCLVAARSFMFKRPVWNRVMRCATRELSAVEAEAATMERALHWYGHWLLSCSARKRWKTDCMPLVCAFNNGSFTDPVMQRRFDGSSVYGLTAVHLKGTDNPADWGTYMGGPRSRKAVGEALGRVNVLDSECGLSVDIIRQATKKASSPLLQLARQGSRVKNPKGVRFELRERLGMVEVRDRDAKHARWRVYLPPSTRVAALAEAHDARGHAHAGETEAYLSVRVYWDGLAKSCAEYTSACDVCQRKRVHQGRAQMGVVAHGNERFARWQVDLADTGKAEAGVTVPEGDPRYVLVARDECTSEVRVEPVATKEADAVARAFELCVGVERGVPARVTVDNGTEFASVLVRGLTRAHVDVHFSPPNDPRGHGFVERVIKDLRSVVATRESATKRRDTLLHWKTAAATINARTTRATGFQPDELTLGMQKPTVMDRVLRVQPPGAGPAAPRLNAAVRVAGKRRTKAAARAAADAAKRARAKPYTPERGDVVYVRNHTARGKAGDAANRNTGPYKVLAVRNGGMAVVLGTTAGVPLAAFKLVSTRNVFLAAAPFVAPAGTLPARRVEAPAGGGTRADAGMTPAARNEMEARRVAALAELGRQRAADAVRVQRNGRDPPGPRAHAEEDGAAEYEVEKITDMRTTNGGIQYLVLWKGYPPSAATWEAHSEMVDTAALQAFQQQRRAGRRQRGV